MTEPLYATLADTLRERIERGQLQPGDRLPSERDLADETGYARGTVRAAIKALVDEGLATALPQRGYIVRQVQRLQWVATSAERNADTDVSPSDAWSRSIRAAGRTPAETIKVEIVRADAELAERLAIEYGDPVVARRRLRSVDGRPYMIADSYYAEEIVRGTPIAAPGDVLPGVYAIFEAMGRPWLPRKRDYVIARPPTPDEVRLLDIPPSTHVLRIGRVSTDAGGTPVRYSVYVIPSDRGEAIYDFDEEG